MYCRVGQSGGGWPNICEEESRQVFKNPFKEITEEMAKPKVEKAESAILGRFFLLNTVSKAFQKELLGSMIRDCRVSGGRGLATGDFVSSLFWLYLQYLTARLESNWRASGGW